MVLMLSLTPGPLGADVDESIGAKHPLHLPTCLLAAILIAVWWSLRDQERTWGKIEGEVLTFDQELHRLAGGKTTRGCCRSQSTCMSLCVLRSWGPGGTLPTGSRI